MAPGNVIRPRSPAPVDLSGMLQPTPYPQNPIAMLLQAFAATRFVRRQQEQKEQDRVAQEQYRALLQRISEAQLASQQFNLEQARLEAAQQARQRPITEARGSIDAASLLAGLTGQPQTVAPNILEAAFPGLNLPKFQGPFADVPGTNVPPFVGEVKPLKIQPPAGEQMIEIPGLGAVPLSEASKLIGAEGVRRLASGLPLEAPPTTSPEMLRIQQGQKERNQQFLRDKMYELVRNPRSGINPQALAQQMVQLGMNPQVEVGKAQERVAKERREATAVEALTAQRRRAPTPGEAVIGPPLPGGGRPEGGALAVRPIRDKRGAITHYLLNGERFTVKEARTEARRRAIEENDENLARRLGITQAQITQWRQATPAVKERETLERRMRSIEDEKRRLGQQFKGATTTTGRASLSAKIQALTDEWIRLRQRLVRLGGAAPSPPRASGSQAIPVPPAIPGGQVVPEGAPTATNPQTGQRIYWDGRQWVPVR